MFSLSSSCAGHRHLACISFFFKLLDDFVAFGTWKMLMLFCLSLFVGHPPVKQESKCHLLSILSYIIPILSSCSPTSSFMSATVCSSRSRPLQYDYVCIFLNSSGNAAPGSDWHQLLAVLKLTLAGLDGPAVYCLYLSKCLAWWRLLVL